MRKAIVYGLRADEAEEAEGSGFSAALVRDRSTRLLPPSVCLTVSQSVLPLLNS